jgi:hypothetical protein
VSVNACLQQLTRSHAIGQSYAMIRIVSVLLSLAFVFFQGAIAADRILVAEGDYVAQTKDGSKPQSHWKLWRLENGEYEAVDTSTKNSSSVQIFRFDAQFLPSDIQKHLCRLRRAV